VLIYLFGSLLILISLIDLSLTMRRKIIRYPNSHYKSFCIRWLKQFVMYGDTWNGFRVTTLIDRIYNRVLLIVGLLAVSRLDIDYIGIYLLMFVPSITIVILIESLKKIITGRDISVGLAIVRSIYFTCILYLLVGSMIFLYQNDHDGIRIILFLLALPFCNSIYRKFYFRLNRDVT